LSAFFLFNDPAPTDTYTLSLHDALPISGQEPRPRNRSTRSRRSRHGRSPAAQPAAPALRRGSRFRQVAERARPQARLPLAPPVLLGRRRHTATDVERACSNCESRLRRQPADAALRPVLSPRPSHAKRTPPPQSGSSHLLSSA